MGCRCRLAFCIFRDRQTLIMCRVFLIRISLLWGEARRERKKRMDGGSKTKAHIPEDGNYIFRVRPPASSPSFPLSWRRASTAHLRLPRTCLSIICLALYVTDRNERTSVWCASRERLAYIRKSSIIRIHARTPGRTSLGISSYLWWSSRSPCHLNPRPEEFRGLVRV